MPQMSPMNWMSLSFLFLTFYYILKMNTNLNFKSKVSEKKSMLKMYFSTSW